MKRVGLIRGLNGFLEDGEPRWKGQESFARFLIEYLTRLDLSTHEKYDFWRIDPYVPQILLDALEELRTGIDEYVVGFRQMYEKETGHEVPNITDIGASSAFDQCSAIQTTLGFLIRDAMGEEARNIGSRVDSYCNAQNYVLQQYFDKFVRQVYRKGLSKIITNSKVRGMGGKFGKTELRAFSIAGRLMFTFARKEGEDEINVSFVGEKDDPNFYSSGLQSVNANFVECLSMISEVIDGWPEKVEDQKEVFMENEHITLG